MNAVRRNGWCPRTTFPTVPRLPRAAPKAPEGWRTLGNTFCILLCWFGEYIARMLKPRALPIALTIAGSDSGGGAGIQADLRTFAALGVHGTTAITCVTAQNPKEVRAIQPMKPDLVWQQLEAVFSQLPPRAVKTGMLFSTEIIHAVAKFFGEGKRRSLIVDPVMASTSGAPLLEPSAIGALKQELLPLALLVTPNLHEAELLAGFPIREPEEMRSAARRIAEQFGCAALVKGGHLQGTDVALDILFDGRNEYLLEAPFVKGISTHGTGCTYSAAITGYCALGCNLLEEVQSAKDYISQAIAESGKAGGFFVLNHFAKRRRVSVRSARK